MIIRRQQFHAMAVITLVLFGVKALAHGQSVDCNSNGIADACDISCSGACSGVANCGQIPDCQGDGIPDDCQLLDASDLAGPAKDFCADALYVCPPATYAGSTVGSNRDGADYCGTPFGDEAGDVYYRYTPQSNGTLTVELCGSGYDTILSIHDGCPCTQSNEICCGDDTGYSSCTGSACGFNESLSVTVAAGTDYWIRITGYWLEEGSFALYVEGPSCLIDCNDNGIPDDCDALGNDCNGNRIPDECELAGNDCNTNGLPDDCELAGNDCNVNGIPDECELAGNDCNVNGLPDDCELAGNDCNVNGLPDDCELAGNDCNVNGIPDDCELAGNDCNVNGIPDDCELAGNDCNVNGIPDDCELAGNDCNVNGIPDDCELAGNDCNGNRVPDECEQQNDCQPNGVQDICDIAAGTSDDCNENKVPDECEEVLPIISQHPTNTTVVEGTSAALSVVAAGWALTYQWQKDGLDIAGEGNSSYRLVNAALNDSGSYRVLVISPCGAVLSNTASLTVIPLEHELAIMALGEGTVQVDPPAQRYGDQVLVKITAIPAEGWYFSHWDGSVLGTNPTMYVLMVDDTGVIANFKPEVLEACTLTVHVEGHGSVSMSPFQNAYEVGTPVRVEASPAEGWRFVEWTGDAEGSESTTTIVMDRDRAVNAVFVEEQPVQNDSTNNNGLLFSLCGIGSAQIAILLLLLAPVNHRLFARGRPRRWY